MTSSFILHGQKIYTTICHSLNTVVLLLFSCVFNHIFKSHTTQRDDRGSIDRLRVGGKRINLLFSKTGVMRSGYLHPETKYDFVVSGEVEVWILTNHGTDKKVRSRSNDVMTLYERVFLKEEKKLTSMQCTFLVCFLPSDLQINGNVCYSSIYSTYSSLFK
jgi:hypothetical protein